jgi:hypothetical protein
VVRVNSVLARDAATRAGRLVADRARRGLDRLRRRPVAEG